MILRQPDSVVWLFSPLCAFVFSPQTCTLGIRGPKRRKAECTTEQHEAR
jgi:hypothetical protein